MRVGEERASFEETPAQIPMINFFSEESSEKLPIGKTPATQASSHGNLIGWLCSKWWSCFMSLV